MKLSSLPTASTGIIRTPRKCNNWLTSYLKYTWASESPNRFHFWSGVASIAGALRRKVWLDMGLFEWTPNFFIFLVAPPGIVSKSTTAGIAMDLLQEVPGVKFGPSSVTWQALIERFEEVLLSWRPDGADLCGPGLEMSCLTIAASELGTFFNPDDREMIDVLVHLWDGKRGRFEKTTIGRGTKVATNPWLNLIACTTPRWIAEHLSSHFTGGGFSSRSIFVFANSKRRLVAYPHLEMGAAEEHLRDDLLADLKRIASLYGGFKLTPEAIAFGKNIYQKYYESPPAALATELLMGYIARKQTHLHKLAMVLSVAESDSLIIEKRHLEYAEESLVQIECDMPRVFKSGKAEPVSGLQEALLWYLNEKQRVKKDSLFRVFYNLVGWESFQAAVVAVTKAGYAVERTVGTECWLEINPEIAGRRELRLVVPEG